MNLERIHLGLQETWVWDTDLVVQATCFWNLFACIWGQEYNHTLQTNVIFELKENRTKRTFVWSWLAKRKDLPHSGNFSERHRLASLELSKEQFLVDAMSFEVQNSTKRPWGLRTPQKRSPETRPKITLQQKSAQRLTAFVISRVSFWVENTWEQVPNAIDEKNPTNLVDTNNTIVPCFDRVSCISTAVGFCSSREAEIYIHICFQKTTSWHVLVPRWHPSTPYFKGENGGKTLGMGAP